MKVKSQTMTATEETYCRLCAEPTPEEDMITGDGDVGMNSKILTKMLWINVDVSDSNNLPKTICFSCFDLLERTWSFLHNVRTAQSVLASIFRKNDPSIPDKSSEIAAKPVDTNWEQFQNSKTEVKGEPEVKRMDEDQPDSVAIKLEPNNSDFEDNAFDDIDTSDSEAPLRVVKKKARKKRKKKVKLEEEMVDIEESKMEIIPLDIPMYALTWEDYTWCCGECNAQCKTVDSLRLHSLEIHQNCCVFKCPDCSKILTNYKLFVLHIRMHYKSLCYYCDICNQHFEMSSLVKKHRRSHKEKYVCENCGARFKTEELLHNHNNSYSKGYRKHKKEVINEELKCDICNRKFKSKSNLQSHKLLHTERTRNFSCHVCGKLFYTKGALSTHMMTHEDAKPYKCDFCSMAFRARGNLTSHISLHSEAKPFVCEKCGKGFRVKRHLKSHSIIHTDLMPYVCCYCNKRFRFKTRLNLHVRQHTGAKPYNCVLCHRDFTNGSNYKKHMYRRHNIDTSVRKKYNNVNKDVNVSQDNGNETQDLENESNVCENDIS